MFQIIYDLWSSLADGCVVLIPTRVWFCTHHAPGSAPVSQSSSEECPSSASEETSCRSSTVSPDVPPSW